MKRSLLLIIFLSLFFSCSVKEEVSIDSITTKEVNVLTSFDGLEVYQQGLGVTISSLDFDVNQNYGITITSPLETYFWHANESPVEIDKVPSILIGDIFMPPLTQFPAGVYLLEILQEDTSFVKSSFEYSPSGKEIEGEPIRLIFEERDGSFYVKIMPELQGQMSIDFYDVSHTLVLTLNDVLTHEKLQDESFRASIDRVIVHEDGKNMYRIVL